MCNYGNCHMFFLNHAPLDMTALLNVNLLSFHFWKDAVFLASFVVNPQMEKQVFSGTCLCDHHCL